MANLGQFDLINLMTTVSVITLVGFHLEIFLKRKHKDKFKSNLVEQLIILVKTIFSYLLISFSRYSFKIVILSSACLYNSDHFKIRNKEEENLKLLFRISRYYI
jgi:hypothetical protein